MGEFTGAAWPDEGTLSVLRKCAQLSLLSRSGRHPCKVAASYGTWAAGALVAKDTSVPFVIIVPAHWST